MLFKIVKFAAFKATNQSSVVLNDLLNAYSGSTWTGVFQGSCPMNFFYTLILV